MVTRSWQSGFMLALLSGLPLEKNIVPNEFQLTATISLMSGQNTLVDVGTGYRKTLCMIILCLLDSPGLI